MAALERSVRPLAQCLRCTRHEMKTLPIRSFSTSSSFQDNETQQVQATRVLDPLTVSTPRLERKLLREQGKLPIGSRRRRRAIASSANIPFEQLPYQCFQEARKFLQEDRNEKLQLISLYRQRIQNLGNTFPGTAQEMVRKESRLRDMRRKLEATKILADINDPLVKKKFEDGFGDLNKPIYRHLADRKWRAYERMLLIQRIEQMNVVPDILPEIDPIVQTALTFPSPVRADRGRKVQHGEMVDSRVSENPPNLTIQPFAKGEKLYTIVCMNPDVPNVEHDGFDYRCHFLACNIPISPTSTLVQFDKLNKSEQVVLPWLPAYAQKGLPYQRMAIFVLEQPPENKIKPGSNDEPPSVRLDLEEVKSRKDGRFSTRHMTLRSLVKEFKLSPVGVDLFRTEWDEGTPGVMKRAGVIGHDIEFKRKRVEPLPYKRLKEERYR